MMLENIFTQKSLMVFPNFSESARNVPPITALAITEENTAAKNPSRKSPFANSPSKGFNSAAMDRTLVISAPFGRMVAAVISMIAVIHDKMIIPAVESRPALS